MPCKISKLCLRVCVVVAEATAVAVVWLEGGMKICGGTILLNWCHVLLSENDH